jgi:hypothetical protein
MDKKGVLAFILTVSGLPIVSAAITPQEIIGQTIQAVKDLFTPIFTSLFNTSSADKFLFAKVLLAILLYVIVSAATRKIEAFKKQKAVSVIISIVVSIFAVRFISDNQLIMGILLPYGVLGVALTTILPFLIFFWFIHSSQVGPFGRKVTWIFFGIAFLFLWISRYSELSDTSNYIYVATLIGAIIAMIWDKSVHSYFQSAERKKKDSGHIKDRINELRYRRDRALYSRDNRRADELEDEIKELEKKL